MTRKMSLIAFAVFAVLATAFVPTQRSTGADDKAPSGGALTDESLRKMLTDMGYEFKETRTAANRNYYQLTLDRDGWALTPYVEVSPDNRVVRLQLYLQKVPPDHKSPAPHLRALLEANSLSLNFFNVFSDTGFIVLNRALDNHGITPALLRRNLEEFDSYARKTVDLWNVAKWGTASAAPPIVPKDLLPRHDSIRPASPPPKKP